MPVHDWTRVDAGIFHAFHVSWIGELMGALNNGLLPSGYYALAEQIAGGREPDLLTLRGPTSGQPPRGDPPGGVALASAPPRVSFHSTATVDVYGRKARAVVIRHTSRHQVIAMVGIVSPGNKDRSHSLRSFVEKAGQMLRSGIHLLVVDLFPPGSHDPEGIHKAVWDEVEDVPFDMPADTPLTLAAYIGGPYPEAFVESVAVGDALPDMPLFLTPGCYIPVPLQRTYDAAFGTMPSYWRDQVASPS